MTVVDCTAATGKLFVYTLAGTIRFAQIAETKRNAKLASIKRPVILWTR